MPRYFFDIHDATGFHRDEFGNNCDDFEDACQQCQCLLPDIAREELPDGDLYTITCEVRDDEDRLVYRGRLIFEGTRDPV